VKILNDNNLVAIGKVILKDRENVIALGPYQRGLVMHVFNYLDDMKPVDKIPEMGNTKAKLDPQEISLGKILVQKYRSKEFDIGDYSDTYVQELRKLIDAKSKGKNSFHLPLRRLSRPKISLKLSRPALKPRRNNH
jgi:DNA end-binding protein Ku